MLLPQMMLIPAVLLTACVLMLFARGIFSGRPAVEKFEVYRPQPRKDTWAKDTVLTQVMSSGKLA